MINSDIISVHVLISGQVQGVGYRYSTVLEARKLGVRGWVRNLVDGRVEAIFEGTETLIQQMVQWCYQGPKSAKVTDVVVERIKFQSFADFQVRPTN